jgi:hypothetical protein
MLMSNEHELACGRHAFRAAAQVVEARRADTPAGLRMPRFPRSDALTDSASDAIFSVSLHAGIAQLVERHVANVKVAGSNPVSRSFPYIDVPGHADPSAP